MRFLIASAFLALALPAFASDIVVSNLQPLDRNTLDSLEGRDLSDIFEGGYVLAFTVTKREGVSIAPNVHLVQQVSSPQRRVLRIERSAANVERPLLLSRNSVTYFSSAGTFTEQGAEHPALSGIHWSRIKRRCGIEVDWMGFIPWEVYDYCNEDRESYTLDNLRTDARSLGFSVRIMTLQQTMRF